MPPAARAPKRYSCRRCGAFFCKSGLWYHQRFVCKGVAASRPSAVIEAPRSWEVPCERCGVALLVRLDSSRHYITQRHECAPAPVEAAALPPPPPEEDLPMDLGDGLEEPHPSLSGLPPSVPEDLFQWLQRVLLCWAARYNISERAMDQLLRALSLLFSVLCERGVPAGSDVSRGWPTRFVEMAGDEADEENDEQFHDVEGQREMAAALVEARHAGPLSSKRDRQQASRFVRYAMCPERDCGRLYQASEALELQRNPDAPGCCTRPLSQPVERPTLADMERDEYADLGGPDRVENFRPWAPNGKPLPPNAVCGGRVLKLLPAGGGRQFVPELMMPYRPLCWYLRQYLLRPNFERDIDHWKKAEGPADAAAHVEAGAAAPKASERPLRDIYDGAMWSDRFRRKLAQSHVLGLTLNIDWFQPHKRTQHSTGAVYLCILNLPREQRFLPCNTMLVALLPGPAETSRTQLQSALKPLVEELRRLEQGVVMPSARHAEGVRVRAFLMQVVNDLPAARMTCGFATHGATYGCSVCELKLQGSGADRGSTDRDSWKQRTDHSHRDQALEWAGQSSETDRDKFLKDDAGSMGSRWCALMGAPHFDTVDGVCIDVMHNFFLGTCAAVMRLLTEKHDLSAMIERLRGHDIFSGELLPPPPAAKASARAAAGGKQGSAPPAAPPRHAILDAEDLQFLQAWVDSCQCPRSVGRLPGKIGTATGFSSMTAMEWCNWSAIFCVPAVRDLLLSRDAEFLQLDQQVRKGGAAFKSTLEYQQRSVLLLAAMPLLIDCARASMLMRQYTLVTEEIEAIDASTLRILSRVQLLFGPGAVTPNMHMSTHIKRYIELWGPPAGWWCFSHERANGILGRFPSNNLHVELSMMHRWTVQMNIQQQTCMGKGAQEPQDASSRQMRQLLHDFTFGLERTGPALEAYEGEAQLLQSLQHNATASGNFRQVYTWTCPASFLRFRSYSQDASVGDALFGWERLPGAFRGAGVEYDLKRWLLEVQPPDASGAPAPKPLLPASQLAYRNDVHPNDVLQCLQTHYADVYASALVSSLSFEDQHDYLVYGSASVVVGQNLPQLDTRVRIFNRLDMAGQVYGSRAGGRAERNSYVAVLFHANQGPGVPRQAQYAYGQVQFYLEHSFGLNQEPPRVHRFALVRWFRAWKPQIGRGLMAVQPVGPAHDFEPESPILCAVQGAAVAAHRAASKLKKQPASGADRDQMLRHVAPFVDTYALDQVPVFHQQYGPPEDSDLIPVHRLAFKWIPKAESTATHGRWFTALRMPSTVHG